MRHKDPASRSQLHAIQYWYMDGIFELGFGLLCLVIGAYLYVENLLQGSRVAPLVDVLLVGVVIGGSFLLRFLVQKMKERLIFPRTGYVSYSRKGKIGQTILFGLVILSTLGAVVIILPFIKIQISTWPLLSGILFGVVMTLVGWRISLPRFYLYALLSLLAGIGLSFSSWGNHVALVAFYLVVSLLLLISGTFLLCGYMRRNPASQEE